MLVQKTSPRWNIDWRAIDWANVDIADIDWTDEKYQVTLKSYFQNNLPDCDLRSPPNMEQYRFFNKSAVFWIHVLDCAWNLSCFHTVI